MLNPDDLKELRAVAQAVVAFDPNEAGKDEPPTCLDCGGEYTMRTGDEPTPFDDGCAHGQVQKMATALVELIDEVGRLRARKTLTLDAQARLDAKVREYSDERLVELRAQLDCGGKGCGTDETKACLRCCRILIANGRANHGDACDAENERLRGCLHRANVKHERFEHLFYLALGELEDTGGDYATARAEELRREAR